MDKGRVKIFSQPYAKYERQRIEPYSLRFVQRNEFLNLLLRWISFLVGTNLLQASNRKYENQRSSQSLSFRQPQKSLRHDTVEKQYGVWKEQ